MRRYSFAFKWLKSVVPRRFITDGYMLCITHSRSLKPAARPNNTTFIQTQTNRHDGRNPSRPHDIIIWMDITQIFALWETKVARLRRSIGVQMDGRSVWVIELFQRTAIALLYQHMLLHLHYHVYWCYALLNCFAFFVFCSTKRENYHRNEAREGV